MAKSRVAFAIFAACSFGAVGACGNDGPPPGYGYGAIDAPCRADYDCGGLFCVDFRGGTCQAACRVDLDCGPGFHCHGESRRGTGGNVDVCVPN